MTEQENQSTSPKDTLKNTIQDEENIPKEVVTKYGTIENISEETLEKEITFNKEVEEKPKKYSWLKIFYILLFFILIFNVSYISYMMQDKSIENTEEKKLESYTELVPMEEETKVVPLINKTIKKVVDKPLPIVEIEKTVAKPLEDAIEKALEKAVEKLQKEVAEPITEEKPKEVISKEVISKEVISKEVISKEVIPKVEKKVEVVKKEVIEKEIIKKTEVKEIKEVIVPKVIKKVEIEELKTKEIQNKKIIEKKIEEKEEIPSFPSIQENQEEKEKEKKGFSLPIKNPDDYIDVIEMRSVASKIEVTHRRRPLSPEDKKDLARKIAKEKLLEQMRN